MQPTAWVNMTKPISLHIISGCFLKDRDCLAHKAENIYYMTLYRKSLLIPVLDH